MAAERKETDEGTSPSPGQHEHIEALVVAFSNSQARDLVGTDALRTVVAGQYRELVRDGTLDLGPIWTLLESQPGFEASIVEPPLCRYKLWSDDLEIDVLLPEQLQHLSSLEIATRAESCRVPSADLDRALGRGRFGEEARKERAAKWSEEAAVVETSDEMPMPSRRRQVFTLATIAIAVIGFGVAGYVLYKSFAPPSWESISTGWSGDIPVKKAVQNGFDVGITLADDGWMNLPVDDRREQLAAALRTLSRRGVRTVFVRDSSGKVRAAARASGDPPAIRVSFP